MRNTLIPFLLIFFTSLSTYGQFGSRSLKKDQPSDAFVKLKYTTLNDEPGEGFGFPNPTDVSSLVVSDNLPQDEKTRDWTTVEVKSAELYYNKIALMVGNTMRVKYSTDKKFLTDTLRIQRVRDVRGFGVRQRGGLEALILENSAIRLYEDIRWPGYWFASKLVYVQFTGADPYDSPTYYLNYNNAKAFKRSAERVFAQCAEILKRIEQGDYFPREKSNLRKLAQDYEALCGVAENGESAISPETKSPEAGDSKKEGAEDEDAWELVFEEEFNEDLQRWNAWNSGAFNEEIQYYWEEQLSLKDGLLNIAIERRAITGSTLPTDAEPKDFEYVSGRIESKDLFTPTNAEGEQEYRFVARIKLPSGHGMWPAFWTYGSPWPTKGEIDIIELRGGEPDRYISNLFYGPNPGKSVNSDTVVEHQVGTDLTADFHNYEMIWKANGIDILFDGKLMHSYQANSTNNIDKFFGQPQMIVLNTAVGGWFFNDRNSENYTDSATMQVDWVRVYKR